MLKWLDNEVGVLQHLQSTSIRIDLDLGAASFHHGLEALKNGNKVEPRETKQ